MSRAWEIDRETFYLLMDHQLAPGYCLWLAPHSEIAALGVAGHQRTFKPTESLEAARTRFADVADLGAMRIVRRKGSVIPTGGRLRHVYRDDERGRVLLLGDAAGLCGAATGGGIYPALICGRLAAHAVANEVLNGARGAVRSYLGDLGRAGGLGPYLRVEVGCARRWTGSARTPTWTRSTRSSPAQPGTNCWSARSSRRRSWG